MDVKGKIVIINGASSGIGKALGIELAKVGATVVICARREDKLKQTWEEIRAYSPESIYRACDCIDIDQVRETVKIVYEKYGRIDIMMNIAGLFEPKFVKDSTWEDYYRDIDVCFLGAVRFNQEVLPIMIEQNRGIILNTSSINEHLRPPGISAYAATKAAVYAYSDTMYKEVRENGIHVGVIQPVLVKTEMTESQDEGKSLEEVAAEIAEGALGSYREIISFMQIQDPQDSAREIIKKGIEKERFEVFTGGPTVGTLMGILMNMFPGLNRGAFSFALSTMDPELGLLEGPEEGGAGLLSKETLTQFESMNRMVSLSNPVGNAVKEMLVMMDEGMNRTVYSAGKYLLRRYGSRKKGS